MKHVKERIVELAIIGKLRNLNVSERREWEESRRLVISHQWKLNRIWNLMCAARIGGDKVWLSELKAEMKQLEGR